MQLPEPFIGERPLKEVNPEELKDINPEELKEVNPEDIKQVNPEKTKKVKTGEIKQVNPEEIKQVNPEEIKEVPPELNAALELNVVFQTMDLLARIGTSLRATARTRRSSPSTKPLFEVRKTFLLMPLLAKALPC